MNLYKISNPKFTGEVEVLYNDQNLQQIDFSNAQIEPELIAGLKKALPPTLQGFLQGTWCSSETTVVEGAFVVTLEDFKREYPYQRNTHLLPPIWDKMHITEQAMAVAAAKAYRRYCKKNESWYNPKVPATWLKAKEYLNNWDKM